MSRQVALSVVVPAYREGAHIHDSLQLLLTELDACQQDYEVVLVADGSPDDTVAEASRVGSSRIRIVSSSTSASEILTSPARTSPLSRTRSRTSTKPLPRPSGAGRLTRIGGAISRVAEV